MPLRSVEAATRDDAIAAAREQFGPHARVVGVRRVRSGGVLGFFATERYVAEVAPDQFARPGVPAPSTGPAQATPAAAYDSPLAAAAPARARSTAPARNGAAAWAAEAARPGTAEPTAPSRSPATRPAEDDERIDELAGLLGGAPGGAPAPAGPAHGRPSPTRATFPKATRERAPASRPQHAAAPSAPVEQPPAARDEAAVAPSPFTAALARMVSGDRDVRQAVDQALARPTEPAPTSAPVPAAPAGAAAARPSLAAAAIRSADPSMRSQAVHQEESTVRDQATAPPSASTSGAEELPTWAAEPHQPAAPAASARQEEIAEALRDALAQGHSDDALAGILRKMLAGDSPREALAEPGLPLAVADEPALPAEPTAPVVDVPVLDAVRPTEPVVADLLFAPATTLAAAPEPVVPAPSFPLFDVPAAPAPVSAGLGWGGSPAGIPLWGEPVPAPPIADDAPIWADVLSPAPAPVQEPVAEEAVLEETVLEETVLEETVLEETVLEETVAEEPVPDEVPAEATAVEATAVEEAAVEEAAVEEVAVEEPGILLAEAAPLLARTASDPAPLAMSLDATTVMPRISLLPPMPGARGRGLPPVPPSSSGRPAVPPSRTGAPGPRDDVAPTAPEVGAAPATPAGRALATVTRLPVGPLMAGDDHPEISELENRVAEPAADAPAPRTGRPGTPREVVARLTELGVPVELLGGDIADRIEADGTYAALTHALAARLPEAPRLPTGAGEVLFVVGPGVETLRAARALAASLRLDPDRVQWATRGDLAGLAPKGSRMTTIDAAVDRRQEAADAGTLTVVAVDAPLRSDVYWMSQMLAIWSPVAVWAVVEATRKPEDLELWLDGLARVDALVVQDTDLSADPAAVLQRLTVPVALLDGVRATPHRWASLLCERLDSPQA
ncbi:hypothetical protein ACI79P_01850 [Blastococcus sp. SYSU DS0510]